MRVRSFWNAQSRARRELLILAFFLGIGLLSLPWLIWLMGQSVLGPYARGGVLRFVGDFFIGLGHGALVFWIVALGPYVLVLLLRLFWRGIRGPVKSSAAPDGL